MAAMAAHQYVSATFDDALATFRDRPIVQSDDEQSEYATTKN
jgi:hypothetical protein